MWLSVTVVSLHAQISQRNIRTRMRRMSILRGSMYVRSIISLYCIINVRNLLFHTSLNRGPAKYL